MVAPQLDAEDLATRLSEAVDRDRSGSVDASAVLNVVAVLQLIVGFAALTLLGAFQSANALQVFLATMVVSVAVLVLGVSLARHVCPSPLDHPTGFSPQRSSLRSERCVGPRFAPIPRGGPDQPQSARTRIWSSSSHHGPGPAGKLATSPRTGRLPASKPLSSNPSAS